MSVKMKKILVACGSGIATSTVARNKLEEELQNRGFGANKVSFDQTSIPQVRSKAADYNLIVTTARYKEDVGTPVVNGLCFLTGVGIDQTVDTIIQKLDLN